MAREEIVVDDVVRPAKDVQEWAEQAAGQDVEMLRQRMLERELMEPLRVPPAKTGDER